MDPPTGGPWCRVTVLPAGSPSRFGRGETVFRAA